MNLTCMSTDLRVDCRVTPFKPLLPLQAASPPLKTKARYVKPPAVLNVAAAQRSSWHSLPQ